MGTNGDKVRLGVFGTSWWADAMYLPAMAEHPRAELVAVCGRRPEPAEELAARWSIPAWYTDADRMLAEADLDAVVVATSNDTHHELTMAALRAGVHVLCEKPLALSITEAEEMAALAEERGAITLVPFTYRYMPMLQWMRRLVEEGFVGTPHQICCRYFTGFGLDGEYAWRFDKEFAGSGIIGDLGSHLVHVARWLIDDTEQQVSAVSPSFVERDPRPDGSAYEQVEDTTVMTIGYRSGALGVLHASAACWEGTVEFGQLQEFDIHGDGGTLHGTCDWGEVQEVRGARRGEAIEVLPIPDDIWGDVRRRPVSDTYRDVFRTTPAMTRGWIDAVADGRPIQPDLAEGLAVQRVLDAAVASSAAGGAPIRLDQPSS